MAQTFQVVAANSAPGTATPGQTVALSASVQSDAAASGMIVDLEVYSPAGTRVAQTFYLSQNFQAFQPLPYTLSYTVPAAGASGRYTLTVGVFTAGWGSDLYWDRLATSFTLGAAPAAASTAVNGACGASNAATLASAPTGGLCLSGSASAVGGTGPWNWSCSGSSGGSAASCTANVSNSTGSTSGQTMTGITVTPNRHSVVLSLPAIANARDYRVLVQPASVTTNANGTENVAGGTIYCAGLMQHNARTRYIADQVTNFPYFFLPTDSETNPLDFVVASAPAPYNIRDLDTPPLRQIEIDGVTGPMTVTVEAIDRLCPFPGTIGRRAQVIAVDNGGTTSSPYNPWIDLTGVTSFPVVTEAQVIANYGALIVNGQGWAGGPNVQATAPGNPPFAQPAPPNPPIVLARATVNIAPLASPSVPTSAFFDDFTNSADTFTTPALPNWSYPRYEDAGVFRLQNSKWNIYGFGTTCCDANAPQGNQGYADAYLENGVLNTILGDRQQDILSEIAMFPRTPAHINASTYLHVTYEVNSFATPRRYWVFSLCGSSTPGQTLDSTGTLTQQIVHSTFFYDNTGASPSTAGWNCLQIFNREGNSYAFGQWGNMHNIVTGARPPAPPNNGVYDLADYISNPVQSIANPTQTVTAVIHPESRVQVMVNKPIPAAYLPEVLGTNEQVVQSAVTSPVNVSPQQLDDPGDEQAWFYQVDANGNPTSPMLDDQMTASPRTKYDLYIRTNRIIMFVNGQQRLCNDFTTPTTTLNIADAALGFSQVFYHSMAEFSERFGAVDSGGEYHYRYNSPWIDRRTWANVGFEENDPAPASFNPNVCFEHVSMGAENNEP